MRGDQFKEYVLDQLRDVDGVNCRPMFGGHGLYSGPTFFGILYRGQLFFKTSDSTRAKYEERGSQPFKPSEKQTLRNYFEVPPDVIEQRVTLCEWANEAIDLSHERD